MIHIYHFHINNVINTKVYISNNDNTDKDKENIKKPEEVNKINLGFNFLAYIITFWDLIANPNNRNETIKEILLKNDFMKRKNNDTNQTEPKYNQFLEKVIKKMYTKDKQIINNNINIITFNNNFGSENHNQVFRMLDIEEDKNNNETLECPHINNNKNNNNSSNDNRNKKYHINLNNNKKLLLLKNPKIMDNNRFDSKEKVRKFFPNLKSHNKNNN